MATLEILGIDPYREGASIAYGVPYAKVTPCQRNTFKERFSLLACGLEMRREMQGGNIREQVRRAAILMRVRGKF